MRKSLFAVALAVMLLAGASSASAQSANGSDYQNAIGLGLDFGNGSYHRGTFIQALFY